MVNQIALVLILQVAFFSFYYRFGFSVAKIIGRRVCPVCFSVGSTWLTLLIIKTLGLLNINSFLIAILLAESTVGVSYLIEEFKLLHYVKTPDYILKFGIIIYGTLSVMVFAFLNELIGLILFAPIIIFGFSALTPNNIGKEKALFSKSLAEKLKKCCG